MTHRGRALAAGAVVAFASIGIALFLSPWSAAPRRAMGAALARLGIEWPVETMGPSVAADALPVLPETGWHFGGPLTADSLRGRIVVLAVFSDTHPGTFEALPVLEHWHEAYARFGVRVVGVHAPEYAFATDRGVVDRLAGRLSIAFPIVEDPSLQTLVALGGRGSEVRIALAGPDGRVRVTRSIGAPAEDLIRIEGALRALLRETQPDRGFPAQAANDTAAGDTPSRVRTVRLGAASVAQGPLAGAAPGRAQPFTAQFRFEVEGPPYVPYPIGWWIPRPEGVEAARGGAAQFLAIRYDASRVGVVASPPASGRSRLWILRDEAWLPPEALGRDARLDARGASYVDIEAPGLYFVTRGPGTHVLKLSPEDAGVTVHALTFEPDAGASGPVP